MILSIIAFIMQSQLWAGDIALNLSLGLPQMEIENPDSTKAKYDGLALRFGLEVPVYETRLTSLAFNLGYQNFALDNTSDSSQQKESADHKGYYAGFLFSVGNILLGTNFKMMKAEHTSSGLHTYNLDYDYNAIEYLLGLRFSKKALTWGIVYTMSSASIDKKELATLSDADLQVNTIWLQISYSISNIFKD